MTLPAIANPVNSLEAAKFELLLARERTKARGLSDVGRELLPVKPSMLSELPDDVQAPCLEACEMLFAAILSHEDGLLGARRAKGAVELVTARMAAGHAEATVAALFNGPAGFLLLAAADAAPIAFYAMCCAAPQLHIIDRVRQQKWEKHTQEVTPATAPRVTRRNSP